MQTIVKLIRKISIKLTKLPFFKSEKCNTSTNYEDVFKKKQNSTREKGGERGAEQEQQREGREQSSKAGPYV